MSPPPLPQPRWLTGKDQLLCWWCRSCRSCCAASASAATASCRPPAHLPSPNRAGGPVPHSCPTLILGMECPGQLCPPAAELGRGRTLLGPASAVVDGRVALRGRGDPNFPPLHPSPFSSLPFRSPQFLPSLGSQRPFDSGVRVPEQQHHLPAPIAGLPHPSPAPLPQFPSLAAASGVSMAQDLAQPFTGTSWRSCPHLLVVLPFPQTPDSPLPALQLGSGLRRWLGEGFFPGCNFSLLHTVCFERCLEASHPQLAAGAGEFAGCQPREAPAPDPSSLGEITAN